MSIKVLCNVRRQNNLPGSFKAIEFVDKFNNKGIHLLPTKLLLSPKPFKEWFIDRHFELPPDKEWKDIIELLQQKTDKTGEIVDRTGFHGKSYLLPDGTCIGPQKEHSLFLDPDHSIHLPQCGVNGSLEEWQKNVASAALKSSRTMLAISGAFSGYLLSEGVIADSGGFHFFGTSSMGKTTALRIAISISGPKDNLYSWNFTATGAEELACGHNHNFMAFDELKTLDGNAKEAAQKATAFIYTNGTGKAKKRSKSHTPNPKKWETAFLSTGEHSLEEHAQKGGGNRMNGEEVRVIDVPADAGKGMGIFESLPEEFEVASTEVASTYAKYLAEQSQRYYGAPQIAFLEKFVADINDERAEKTVRDRIVEYMDYFRDQHDVKAGSEISGRIADRFALAYAAGCLAIEYGVLPFTSEDVFNGISACYKAALAIAPEDWEEKLRLQVRKLAKYLRSKEFPAMDSRDTWSKKAIEKYDGFSHTINNIQLIALKRDVVKHLIPAIYLNDVLNFCKSKGYLLSDANGNNTRSIALNDKRVRFYCFVFPGDEENKVAVMKRNQGYAAKKSTEKKSSE